MSLKAMNAYKKTSMKQQVAEADPHKLTLLLMQASLERMANAKGCIDRKDMVNKGQHLARATAIISYLRDTLDFDVKSEVTDNLFALYDYMNQRLTDANVQNSSNIVEEVIQLMLPIKQAWESIPESAKQEAYEIREKQQAG
jgi:flagellar protein FliS